VIGRPYERCGEPKGDDRASHLKRPTQWLQQADIKCDAFSIVEVGSAYLGLCMAAAQYPPSEHASTGISRRVDAM
jgi:hypothetical protein